MTVNCLGLLRKFFISSILKLGYVIQKLKKKINLYFIYFRIPSLILNFAE